MLSLYLGLSLSLLVLDHRFHYLEWVRQGVSMVTAPLHMVAHAPGEAAYQLGDYFTTLTELQKENGQLKHSQLAVATTLQRVQHLEAENAHLRALLGAKEHLPAGGQMAQILYAARDPFSRRVIVDKGLQDKVVAGQPVVDHRGLIGQVTRVYPMVSEVTLITDKDQAVPVQVVRSGLRSVVFGLGNGQLELRFLPANADVQNGDLIVTSGLDGVFPAGFPVAKVIYIERDTTYTFARIICAPVGAVESFGEVLILNPREALPPRPPENPRNNDIAPAPTPDTVAGNRRANQPTPVRTKVQPAAKAAGK